MRAVAALAVLVLLAGCGAGGQGDADGPAAQATDGLGDGCRTPAGSTPVSWTVDGTRVTALRVPPTSGDASVAVLVANESDEDLCGWAAALPTLRRLGTVWLHDDVLSPDGVDDVLAVAGRARAAGASRLLLVGASKGAKASLVAATRLPASRLLGVVGLSPEAELADGTPVLGRIRSSTYRTLLLVARNDPYQALPACRAYAAARPSVTTLAVYPGADHGTALFRGASAAQVEDEIVHFVGSLS